MSKVPVDDQMNEVIRKAAQESSDGKKYDLRANIVNENITSEIIADQFEMLININESILQQLKILNLYMSEIYGDKLE